MPDQPTPSPQELHIRLTELENAVKSIQQSLQQPATSPIVCQICQTICYVCHVCYNCYQCLPCRPICYECGGCGPCAESRLR